MKYLTCCGQKLRARIVDGRPEKLPHSCSDSADVRSIDWKALQEAMASQGERRSVPGAPLKISLP